MAEQLSQTEEIKRHDMEHMSPYFRVGVGRKAVEIALREAPYSIKAEQMLPTESAKLVEDSVAEKKIEAIHEARERLAVLPADMREHANLVIAAKAPSEWLRHALGVEEETPDYVGALTAQDEQGYVLDEQVALNFFEWHNHELAKQQIELDQKSEAYKQDYSETFRLAVEEGWIPKTALKNLARLDRTRIVIDDLFATAYQGKLGFAGREVDDDREWVVVSPFEVNTPQHLRHTLLHEMTHVADGRNETDKLSVENQSDRGMYRLFGAGEGGLAMNEAMTEHLACRLERRRGFDLPDTNYTRDRKIYVDERMLLATLQADGVIPVDMHLFYDAYFESDEEAEEKGDDSAQSRLQEALREAFPFTDVVAEITHLKTSEVEPYFEELIRRSEEYIQQQNNAAA